MEAVGKFVIGLILFLVAVLARGLAFSYLWAWFIVPLELPTLGLAWSLGIMGTLFFATNNPHVVTKEESAWTTLTIAITYPLRTLLLGYIYTLFM